MTTFEDRQKSFENKYQHDEQLKFKVNARRNKLLGLWAAEKMGLAGADAEAYAKTVVEADFDRPGHDDVIEKVVGDFAARGVDIAAHTVRHESERLLGAAKQQVMNE